MSDMRKSNVYILNIKFIFKIKRKIHIIYFNEIKTYADKEKLRYYFYLKK